MNAQRDVQGPAKETEAPEAQQEEHAPEHEVAPDAYAGAAAHFRAREAAWRAEAAPIAAELGVTPEIHANEESRQLTEAHGANALAIGNVVHLHPDKIAPGTSEGHRILVHELTHIAQAKKGTPGPRAAAEDEAARAADAGEVKPPQQGIDLAHAAGDKDADKDKDKGKVAAPDLKGAPYQWVPGTFNIWMSRAWFESAPDYQLMGDDAAAPSRVRELLGVLHDKGMLTWADSARIATASASLGLPAKGAPVVNVSLGTTAFYSLGLPPGTQALVGRQGNGFDIILSTPAAGVAQGKDFELSQAAKLQAVAAVEGFTGLKSKPDVAAAWTAPDHKVTVSLGAGTAWLQWNEKDADALFGKDEYDKWLAKPSEDSKQFQFDIGASNQSYGDLNPDEVLFIKEWLKKHAGSGAGGRPIAMTRSLLETLHKIDDLPEKLRDRVYAMMHGGKSNDPHAGADQGMVTSDVLDRMIVQARFDEEREAAGFKPNHGGRVERPPVFDYPIPARIDQKNGLILADEDVEFDVLINWPPAYTADQQSDYTWRPMRATVDWMYERDVGKTKKQERSSSWIDWNKNGHDNHKFHLEKGEDTAIWTVHAFVHHNFFQPAHLVTQVEVKTEEKRLEEMRKQAFGQLGDPKISDKDKDFDTSTFNELFGKRKYDHGLEFRGDLPPDFKRKTPEERKATLESEIKTNEAMLEYLRKEGTHPDAVTACEHYLGKLRDAESTMDDDVKGGWKPFEVRGTFLGRDNHVADGPLDLYGTVKTETSGALQFVTVQIRDLSRRLDSDNYMFSGSAFTYEKALELAFVDLCKKYPGGKVSMLAEGFDQTGTTETGKTVGYELDTGTAWKDTKEKVFDPVVNIAVNIAGAIASIFVPEIAIPLLIIYNETQNIDSLVDEMDSHTLNAHKGFMHLAQLGMDIMPMIGRAPIFRASKGAFALFQVASLGGQAILMRQQVVDQIQAIRDGQIQDMAGLFAQFVDMEKNTQASDPGLVKMRADLDARAEAIRKTAADTWTTAIGQFAIVAIPGHLAGMVHENIRTGRLGDLEINNKYVNDPRVEKPYYEPKTGQIIGDQAHMDLPTIDRLTKEQADHLQKVGGRLADDIGVAPEKVNVQPGDENKIWKDGDKVEVRYKPGTDPEEALKGWEADAKKNKIGKPSPHPHPEPKPEPVGPHEHPTKPADHETVQETTKIDKELGGGGSSTAKETTAAAVPGSDFKGKVMVASDANTAAIMDAAKASLPDMVQKVVATAEVRDAGNDTYLITLTAGDGSKSSLTVRVDAGPVPGDAVARTQVNNTKIGATTVPGPNPGDPPVKVEVKGRYVIQLSETMDPVNAKRAVAHEIGEILAERELSAAGKGVGPDLLKQGGAPEAGAKLSPHDRGRIAEMKVLAEKVNAGDAGAKREMLALIEELGLREGTSGAAERRHLVAEFINDDPAAVSALDTLAKSDATMDSATKAQLDSVRTAREADVAKAQADAAKKAADAPHVTPDAHPDPGQVISIEKAHEMAEQARIARARKSAETLAALRAKAAALPEGTPVKFDGNVQVGGGAALAARDSQALLVDARGRWQADASDRIAQTASQLKGLKDAGIGDPFQFAQPDERVPMSAIRYWEDNIAAQGPVLDGQVTHVAYDDAGHLILTIKPSEGPEIKIEVGGQMSMATGFPPERIPGTPRGMTPDKAVDQVKAALQHIVEDPAASRDHKINARAALAEIKDTTGLETEKGQREKDLTKVRDALKRHGFDRAMSTGDLADAHKMLVAGEKWAKLRGSNPDTVMVADMANLESLNPKAAEKWVIGGLGGTGVSAAEILLNGNKDVPHAHVTMVGDKPPPGLFENDQFVQMVRDHADAQTVAKIKALGGPDIPAGDGKLSVIFGQTIDTPTKDAHGINALAPGAIPDGYTAADNPLAGTKGYVAGIGRENQLPPVAAALQDAVVAKGGKMTMEPMYKDGRYLGYRLDAFDKPPAVGPAQRFNSIEITGAASRFPPWELMEGNTAQIDAAKAKFWAASDFDAPQESGNFDGGFVSSAQQAADYARSKKAGSP